MKKQERLSQVRWRMRIMHSDVIAIGPGKIELLEAVRDHGSITAAAKSMNMSYRRAWLLLNEINMSLASPATVSNHGGANGGASKLTDVGERIVTLYRQIEMQATQANKDELEQLMALLKQD